MNELVLTSLSDGQLDKAIRVSWKRTRTEVEELGKLLIEMRRRKPREFKSYLSELGIPHSTAYYWINSIELPRPEIERSNVGPFPTEVSTPEQVTVTAIEGPSDYAINKVYKEHLREFKQRGQVMVMHIREFLTIEESVGRDLKEAIDNIDKFESQEELTLLKEMQEHCEKLAIRSAEVAKKLKKALETKEKLV